MRPHFFARLLVLSLVWTVVVATGQNSAPKEGQVDWEHFQKQFSTQQSYNLMTSGLWTLTHAAESKQEVEEMLRLIVLLSESFEKKAPASLNEIGGVKGFKDRMASFLTSKDDVVAGFAATMLGISGDRSYAPAIAKLLDKKDPPGDSDERYSITTSRGRAAIALSLMGAREYVPKFVEMTRRRNRYDRAGAASALGQLRAKEHAREVAAMLKSAEFRLADDPSPIYALVEMGAAAEYVDEIADVLKDKFRGEVIDVAAYALAKLGARQYAKDIAALLRQEYRKGDAAKALALMGASEYTDEIARMLKDKEGLVRKDALLALGILRATKYTPQVAEHLKDQSYVSNYAAYALVLLDAEKYVDEIVPLVENAFQKKLYLNADDFNPIVEQELGKIRVRFSDSYLKMKATRPK